MLVLVSNAPEGHEFPNTFVKTIPVVGQLVAIAGEVVALARASALGTALFAAAVVCGFSLWVIFAPAAPKLFRTGLSSPLPPVYRYERHWRRAAMLTICLAVTLPVAVALWNFRGAQTRNQWRPPQIEFYRANSPCLKSKKHLALKTF